jgi:hypothetical protein
MGTPQGFFFPAMLLNDKGNQKSDEYNEVIRVATIKWAMAEQLKNPSPGFEDVIRTHFRFRLSLCLVIHFHQESSAP